MRKGFTLIELLVVVLIVGILAAVALPQYQKSVLKSHAVQGYVFAKHFKDLCNLDLMAGGTCANLQDMGWDYEMTDYNLSENLESFKSAGFYFEHKMFNFAIYLPRDLFFYLYYPKIYCMARSELGESVCKSLGGSYYRQSPASDTVAMYLLSE